MLEKYLCGGCSHDSDSESSSDEAEVAAPARSGVAGDEEVEEVLDPTSRHTTDNSAPSTDTDDPLRSTATDTASLTSSHLAPSRSSNSSNRRPRGPYVLVEKERLMGIYCAVFVARCCEDLVEGVSTGRVTAGLIGGRVGNKGGACVLRSLLLRIVTVRLSRSRHLPQLRLDPSPLRLGSPRRPRFRLRDSQSECAENS